LLLPHCHLCLTSTLEITESKVRESNWAINAREKEALICG
jgi:hypothetical protein